MKNEPQNPETLSLELKQKLLSKLEIATLLYEGLNWIFPKAHIDVTFFYPGSVEPEIVYPEKDVWRFPNSERKAVLDQLSYSINAGQMPYLYLDQRSILPFVDQIKLIADQKIYGYSCEDLLVFPIVEEVRQLIGLVVVHQWHQQLPLSALPSFNDRLSQAVTYIQSGAIATTNLYMHRKIEQWASDKQVIQSQRREDEGGLRKRVLELTALSEISTLLAQSTDGIRSLSKIVAALQKVHLLEVVTLCLLDTEGAEIISVVTTPTQDAKIKEIQASVLAQVEKATQKSIPSEKLKSVIQVDKVSEASDQASKMDLRTTNRLLIFEDKAIGLLAISTSSTTELPDHYLGFLDVVAHHLSVHFGGVTRQRQLERSKLESLVHSMPEGVIVIDQKQRLEIINEMALTLLDLNRSLPITIEKLEAKLIELGLYHYYQSCMRDALPTENLEIQCGDKTLLINIGPVGDQDRHHLGMIIVVRDFTEIQKSNRIKAQRLEVVSQANRIIRSVADLENLLPVIMDYILHIANTDMGSIMIRKDGQFVTKVHSNFPGKILKYYRFQNGECISDHVIKTHEIVYIDHYSDNPAVEPNPRVLLDYYICLPVVIKNDLLAVINIAQKYENTKLKLTQEDIMTFDAIASLIGTAIYNAILYQEALVKQKLDGELRVANEIQVKLLPSAVPQLENAKMGAISVPAKEIGGDYYDFLELENGNLGIIVADIVGKGVAAGLFMAMLKSIVCTHLLGIGSPKDAISRMNEILLKDTVMEKFVPVFYGIYNAKTRMLTYCNAGHEPAIFLNQEGVHLLDTEGFPLGSVADSVYTEKSQVFEEGDILLIHTDGLIEARNREGQELGQESLHELLKKYRELDAQEIVNQLYNATTSFANGASAHDDITMVLLKAELTREDTQPIRIEKYKFNSEKAHIRTIRDLSAEIAKNSGFSEDDVFNIKLAINEAHANVIEHTYGGVPTGEIVFHFCVFHDRLEVMIKDFAPGTDQHAILASKNMDHLEGSGFGVFLMHSVMDKVEYRRHDKVGTELWMVKYLNKEDEKGK